MWCMMDTAQGFDETTAYLNLHKHDLSFMQMHPSSVMHEAYKKAIKQSSADLFLFHCLFWKGQSKLKSITPDLASS